MRSNDAKERRIEAEIWLALSKQKLTRAAPSSAKALRADVPFASNFLDEAGDFGMVSVFENLAQDERGATAIEYGLIAALIAVAAIAAFKLVGTNLSSIFNTVASNL
jgi:pilus assembly protein Flp/PilA